MEDKIINLLLNNGYTEIAGSSNIIDYRTFIKKGADSVCFNKKEVILVNSIVGDWLHLPYNYYALLGALMHHRELFVSDYGLFI